MSHFLFCLFWSVFIVRQQALMSDTGEIPCKLYGLTQVQASSTASNIYINIPQSLVQVVSQSVQVVLIAVHVLHAPLQNKSTSDSQIAFNHKQS